MLESYCQQCNGNVELGKYKVKSTQSNMVDRIHGWKDELDSG